MKKERLNVTGLILNKLCEKPTFAAVKGPFNQHIHGKKSQNRNAWNQEKAKLCKPEILQMSEKPEAWCQKFSQGG